METDKILFIFITLSMIQCNVVVPSSPKREEEEKKNRLDFEATVSKGRLTQ
jgi:hypothetical protein